MSKPAKCSRRAVYAISYRRSAASAPSARHLGPTLTHEVATSCGLHLGDKVQEIMRTHYRASIAYSESEGESCEWGKER